MSFPTLMLKTTEIKPSTHDVRLQNNVPVWQFRLMEKYNMTGDAERICGILNVTVFLGNNYLFSPWEPDDNTGSV